MINWEVTPFRQPLIIMYINLNVTWTSLTSPVNAELPSKPIRATGNNVAKSMLLLGCSSKSAIAQNLRLVTLPTNSEMFSSKTL